MTLLPSDDTSKAQAVAGDTPPANKDSNVATSQNAPTENANADAPTVAEPAPDQDKAATESQVAGNATTSASAAAQVEAPPEQPRRSLASVLLPTLVTFYSIGIALWLIFAWSGYDSKYSQATDSWKLNSTKMIEITLIAEDKTNLACASDVSIEGLHCGYDARRTKVAAEVDTDPQILQPYNTVANELFMGAGLWTSPVLKGPLPNQRFTVMCNYKVLGAAKNVSLRWAPKAAFDPLKSSVAVGTLSDCVIPQ